MIKKIKYPLIIASITLFGFVAWIIGTNIYLNYLGAGVHSPVIWQNLKITFPKEIAYTTGNRTEVIAFFLIEEPDARIDLTKFDLHKITKDSLIHEIEKRGYTIISSTDGKFHGYDSFEVTYIDDENFRTRDIVIKQQNLIISFIGDPDKHFIFEEIINNIEFQLE